MSGCKVRIANFLSGHEVAFGYYIYSNKRPGAYLIFGLFGGALTREGRFSIRERALIKFSTFQSQIHAKFIRIFYYTTKCNMTLLSNKTFLNKF